ncbi:MAG: hypothetical protein JNK37_19980 [Verrucomicrobiales bacterium]|nr:hypothetical protein [Verrucomicrobiales bacterium]
MNQIDRIPRRRAAALVISAIFPSRVASFVRAQETESRFEKQLAPIADAPVGEWWKASWQEGWTYEHRGDFSLSARAKVKNKSDVFWFQALASGVADLAGELNLEVRGNSQAESGVLQNGNGEILLSRYYPRTDVTRSIFRKPVGDPTIVDKLLDFGVDAKKRSPWIKNLMSGLAAKVGTVAAPTGGLDPASGAVLAGMVGRWIGEKADDLISAKLKEHGIQKRPDGGVEISLDSALLRAMEVTELLQELANLAMQLNEAFNRRVFLIRAAEKSGEELDTREIYSEGKDLVTFAEMKASEGAGKAVEWLKSRMPAYKRPKDLTRGVFQRETFALSSQIFDSQERKPGDTWMVPADFFNTFLHPDLSGRFRGSVVLHYVRDLNMTDRDDAETVFAAREIEILNNGKIDGRTYQSTLEYVETNFSAKLREDTDGVLFIDKTHGYLRQANLNMISDAQASLPDMKILRGFEAVGEVRFEVIYTCKGQPAD